MLRKLHFTLQGPLNTTFYTALVDGTRLSPEVLQINIVNYIAYAENKLLNAV